MASRRGLSVLSGISRGMNQAAQNIWAIQQASNKLSRDKELFDLKKKEMNLQMKKLELDPNMDPDYVQLQKDLMKNKMQAGELSLKTSELTNRKTELANREKLNRLAAAGNALAIEEMAEPYMQQNVANIMGQEVLLGDIQGGPMIAKQKARKEATEFVETYDKETDLEKAVEDELLVKWYQDPTKLTDEQKKKIGVYISPDDEDIDSEEYESNIKRGLEAVQSGIDAWQVYQRIAAEYPSKSTELKRIFVRPMGKEDYADIFGELFKR